MKTKDLIKALQEADPSGELHVMGAEGAIHFVEPQPGYWDGPCHYVEKSTYFPNKYYITDKKPKIVIHEISLETYIWDKGGETDSIIVDLQGGQERKDRYNKRIEKIAAKAKFYEEKTQHEFTVRLLEALKDGNRIINLEERIDGRTINSPYYLSKDGHENGLCQGEIISLYKCGFFKLNETKTEWILALDKEEK